MTKVRILFNMIMLVSRNGARKFKINCSSKDLLYLSLLRSVNVIEFTKVPLTKNKYIIIILYSNGRPIINSIVSINQGNKGNIGTKSWVKESNSRRSLYIAYTSSGIKLVDTYVKSKLPSRLLFKVELN
jgi:hypothetical protein